MGAREFQFLRLTPQQAQEIRMRCLNWVREMCEKGFIKPLTAAEMMGLVKQVEGWTFGGFSPIVTDPTPLGTIEEAADATRNRVNEILSALPPEAKGKAECMRHALGSLERFLSDITTALAL